MKTTTSTKPTLSPAIAENTAAALTPAEHKSLGQELTALYHDAVDGHLRVLVFGARFMEVEEIVSSMRGENSPKRGPGSYGFDSWLRDNAPEIKPPTARRFRDIAQGVADKFKITDPARVFNTPMQELPQADQKKREAALEFTAEKSMRAIQLELGLIERKRPVDTFKEEIDAAHKRGEKLPISCAHVLTPERQKWWDELPEEERIAYNEWHRHLDFFEEEKTRQHYLRLPKIDQMMLKDYVRFFAVQLGLMREKT